VPLQARFFVAALVELEGIFDDIPEVREVQRLGNEIECAKFESLHSGLNIAVGRNDGNRNASSMQLHPPDKIKAIAIRQAHVCQAQVKGLRCEQGFGARNILCRFCADIHAPERERQELTDIRFVINDKR
jgi:hypothetical protein